MTSQNREWEEEFDKKFILINGDFGSGWIEGPKGVLEDYMSLDHIKSFIQKTLNQRSKEIIESIPVEHSTYGTDLSGLKQQLRGRYLP